MRNVRVALSLVPVLLTGLAAAQEPPPGSPASVLTVGSRIRVVSTAVSARLEGAVVAVDETQLTLAPDGGTPLKLPLQSVTRMEVSLGRKRNPLWGMLIGGLAFAALGAAAPVDPNDCGENSDNLCSRGEAIGGLALVGAGLGAGVGALIKTERWAPIAVGGPRVGRRGTRAIGIGVAIRF
jgi:hypothetical protein